MKKAVIYEDVYGHNGEAQEKTLDVFISKIRAKISHGKNGDLKRENPCIKTVWGRGYVVGSERKGWTPCASDQLELAEWR